jgi:hypothetical protein
MNGAWDGVLACRRAPRASTRATAGRIRNVTLRGVAVVDGPLPFSVIAGYDAEHAVENVRFENLTVHGRRVTTPAGARLSVEHARGVTFR